MVITTRKIQEIIVGKTLNLINARVQRQVVTSWIVCNFGRVHVVIPYTLGLQSSCTIPERLWAVTVHYIHGSFPK